MIEIPSWLVVKLSMWNLEFKPIKENHNCFDEHCAGQALNCGKDSTTGYNWLSYKISVKIDTDQWKPKLYLKIHISGQQNI